MQLLLVRSTVDVDRSAQDLFELLTSAEGSSIIDDSTRHDPPAEILQWQYRYLSQVQPTMSCTVLPARLKDITQVRSFTERRV
jgi:hypothetical protein